MRQLALILAFLSLVGAKCPKKTFVTPTSVTACFVGDVCLSKTVTNCINVKTFTEDVLNLTVRDKVFTFKKGAIQNLQHLEVLNLNRTRLTILKEYSLQNLPFLKTVHAASNHISIIPVNVFNNLPIETLLLYDNNIRKIENGAFAFMNRLKTLNLEQNYLNDSVASEWFKSSVSTVHQLILSRNILTVIKEDSFANLPQLKRLDLSHNFISAIEKNAFAYISHLEYLSLEANQLFWIIPEVFPNYAQVDVFKVNHNRLGFLNTTLLSNGHVKAVSLHPNPWQCPCLDIINNWVNNRTRDITLLRHSYRYGAKNVPECFYPSENDDKCFYDFIDIKGQLHFLELIS